MSNLDKRLIQQELLIRRAREDFTTFTLMMNKEFYTQRESVMRQYTDLLNDAWYSNKRNTRVNVAMPPRIGKSYTMNLFVAWSLGKDISREIIRATYSETLAKELHQSVKQILEDETYLTIFPNMREDKLPRRENTTLKLSFKNHNRTSLFATSEGGSVTGFGASIIIVDDLYKDIGEASSPVINQRTIEWYMNALRSRLDHETGRLEILVGTKWVHNELSEELDRTGYFDTTLRFPALVNGESICPEMATTEELLLYKKTMPPSHFDAVYMQNPHVSANALISESHLNKVKYGEYTVNKRYCCIDNKTTGKDAFAVGMFAVTNIGIILEDVIYTNEILTEQLIDRIARFVTHYNPVYCDVEINKDYTMSLWLKDKLKQTAPDVRVRQYSTTENKETKIITNANLIYQCSIISDGDSEYLDFLKDLYAYDPTIKKKDDGIDMFVMGMIRLSKSNKLGGREWLITRKTLKNNQ